MAEHTKHTPKQLKAIDLLALGEMTQLEIALELNIHDCTLTRWKKREGFMESVLMRARELLKADIPKVYKALSTNSKLGSDRHIKIYLDHVEKLEGIRAGKASLTFTWNPPTITVEDTNEED